ncbi:MAG TPA: glycosyltransferase family 4 protein [Pyrinomonadaceae bacterium]
MKSEIAKNHIAKKPKQVLYVWDYLEWGGAQIYFLGIAARIKHETEVRFVFPRATDRQLVNFCAERGLEYEFIDSVADLKPAPSLRRKIERHRHKIKSELALINFLKKHDLKDSVVHVELSPWQSVVALSRLCRCAGQVFVTMHNALPAVSKWRRLLWKLKFSLIARFANFHIFPSNEHAKKSLAPYVSAAFLARTPVTYTNVNPDEVDAALASDFDRAGVLHRFGLPTDKILVFCLGQFIDRKGRWVFLEAARAVLKKTTDIAFVWITNSVLSKEDGAKIESFGLGGHFHLVRSENVGGEHLDLMKFLRLADIYALPSFVEGLPISLLEAMALGIPSVSTNVNAIPEAVKDGETGILIEAGDAAALAAALEKLKNDAALRVTLGRNGRAWVLANFNEKKVAEIALRNYRASFSRRGEGL